MRLELVALVLRRDLELRRQDRADRADLVGRAGSVVGGDAADLDRRPDDEASDIDADRLERLGRRDAARRDLSDLDRLGHRPGERRTERLAFRRTGKRRPDRSFERRGSGLVVPVPDVLVLGGVLRSGG